MSTLLSWLLTRRLLLKPRLLPVLVIHKLLEHLAKTTTGGAET